MLVEFSKILAPAKQNGYAVPAINIYNMETVMGTIAAAESARSPIILQAYSRLFTTDNAYYLAPVIKAAAERATVPVCFHIDHGAGEHETTRALRYGCTGVMIDASALDFEQNVALTRRVVERCGDVGVSVEGELGHVGTVNDDKMDEFTVAADAKSFVDQTGVSALAVLVGSAHGRYKKPPKLDIQRISDIAELCKLPLVLHGGSGIPDEQIIAAIKAGICKINFGTDMCYAFLDSVCSVPRDIVAIDLFMKQPIEAVKQFVLSRIKLLGSGNRA